MKQLFNHQMSKGLKLPPIAVSPGMIPSAVPPMQVPGASTVHVVLPSLCSPVPLSRGPSLEPQPPWRALWKSMARHLLPLAYRKRRRFSLQPSPRSIQRVVILGVHGWFPGRILQTMVTGEPTGTSQLFADKMTLSVRDTLKLPLNTPVGSAAPSELNITRIPLVAEGRVLLRVETFYETLCKDWKEELSKADLILCAAHSQGTPVGTLLLNRLVTESLIDPTIQKIGLLGMAGICHGPFPHLRSSLIVKYVEADAARELFEFNSPSSFMSVTFQSAMMNLLHSGVKVTLVGSWYDQVVPLYSAILYGIDHPRLYRALYIDSKDYTPDFLSHLIVFALKLKNLGVRDYGLLVHLSDTLAGSIYGFGTQGHSALYDFSGTFDVAVNWTLTEDPLAHRDTDEKEIVAQSSHFKAPHSSKLNPFLLPFIFSQLLHSNFTKELKKELESLIELYNVWEPKTKEAKDIKFRLEGIKAKL